MSIKIEETVDTAKLYKGFGGHLIWAVLQPFMLLMLAATVALFVLCGIKAGVMLALLLVARVTVAAYLMTKAENRLKEKNMPVAFIVQRTESEKHFNKMIYIISAVVLACCGGLFAVGVVVKGLDASYISAGICFLLAVCPMEILPFCRLCKMQNFADLSRFGASEWQNDKEIYAAKRMVIRPQDIVNDRLNFACISTYYKNFVPGESLADRDKPIIRTILETAMLGNEATADENGVYQGEKQEIAWIDGASKHAVYKETVDGQCAEKVIRKQEEMTEVGVHISGGVRIITKGDVKAVLASCDRVLGDGVVMPASEAVCADILSRAESYIAEGDFVCALAFSEDVQDKEWAKDKMFLALLVCRYTADNSGVSLVQSYEKAGLKPLLFSPENANRTKAMMRLCGVEKAVCADADGHTDGQADAYYNITEEREKAICETAGDVLVFVQQEENAHLKDKALTYVAINDEANAAATYGRLTYKSDIVPLRETLARTLRNHKKTTVFWLIAKTALLVLSVMWGVWYKALPLNVYQMLCLFGICLPLCAKLVSGGEYASECYEVSAKRKRILTGIFGVLTVVVVALAHIFGRYTVPARSVEAAELFASGMSFFVAYGCIFILALQALSHKILLRFAFVTNKKAVITAVCGILIALVILFVQPVREWLMIPNMPFHKAIWIGAFLGAFLLATDLIKYTMYTTDEE